jgi:AcrR family transcriptional regulator
MAYRRSAQVQARLDGARERIVASTVGLVAGGGWSAVTVAAVAEAAGVATGTVYRHVDGKDHLCVLAFRRVAGHELAVVAEVAGAEASACGRVAAALRTFAGRALRGRRLAHALLTEPAGGAVEAERLRYRQGYRTLFAQLLTEGMAAGELTREDPDVLAAVLTGAMGEALVGPLAPAAAGPGAAVVDQLVTVCLRALPTA